MKKIRTILQNFLTNNLFSTIQGSISQCINHKLLPSYDKLLHHILGCTRVHIGMPLDPCPGTQKKNCSIEAFEICRHWLGPKSEACNFSTFQSQRLPMNKFKKRLGSKINVLSMGPTCTQDVTFIFTLPLVYYCSNDNFMKNISDDDY